MFDGEVINADAMQLYDGLDIATAKLTRAEMDNVPHHLFSIRSPFQGELTIRDYRDMAIKTIENITAAGKLPILVGGTLYYVQSLLWPSLIDESNADSVREMKSNEKCGEKDNDNIATAIGDYSYERLKSVDPETASRLHPSDSRKIRRALEIFDSTGEKQSEIINKQNSLDCRYNCRIIWLDCERGVHDIRLRNRVNEMVERGLVDEIKQFVDKLKQQEQEKSSLAQIASASSSSISSAIESDETLSNNALSKKGIFQTMGLKEFLPIVSNDQNQEEKMQNKALELAIESLFVHHRSYSKKQVSWIKNKFLHKNIPIFNLDTTVVEQWDKNVLDPATVIVKELLSSFDHRDWSKFAIAPVNEKDAEKGKKKDPLSFKHCELCGKHVPDNQWNDHITGSGHKNRLKGMKKRAQREKGMINLQDENEDGKRAKTEASKQS